MLNENLMEELKKVKRVLGKLDVNAPHEVLLIWMPVLAKTP